MVKIKIYRAVPPGTPPVQLVWTFAFPTIDWQPALNAGWMKKHNARRRYGVIAVLNATYIKAPSSAQMEENAKRIAALKETARNESNSSNSSNPASGSQANLDGGST